MQRLFTEQHKFGTAPVFLTAISTILGAIMFLRFGYAVGSVGLAGTLAIIAIGHLVTVPTAMAIAEIATNQKVEGGGEYYIISRSFGLTIGSAIGIALYLSQAISVAFYIIAFAQAFEPVIDYVWTHYGVALHDKRWFSIPTVFFLTVLMLYRGASIGVKTLYVVVAVLAVSLVMFFMGRTGYQSDFSLHQLTGSISSHDSFFYVFAICFPAFTGMTAGVGLSGDLKDPKKSIPVGTLSATFFGMVVYVFIAWKLSVSASPEVLVSDQLIMSRIAVWWPIIPIGLACATLSSAIGSIMVAPRTLQAIATDNIAPSRQLNYWLKKGRGPAREPFNATMTTGVIALLFVLIGDVNVVAEIITMFFMVTYGSLCLISFLQHFAADPAYRPAFRSRWYVSLLGALMCIWLMFKINAPYALLSVFIMTGLYLAIRYKRKDRAAMAHIFQGVIFQLSRTIQVFLQKASKENSDKQWRPSVVCVSGASFDRFTAFDLLKWISHRYGFGTYIHLIEGYLNRETNEEAKRCLDRLIKLADQSHSNVFIDTLISPSYTSALAQIIQLPGISGKENNLILLEFARNETEKVSRIVENYPLIRAAEFDICTLVSAPRAFGYKQEIHIWITSSDYDNANLMILLGYIILGHPEWKNGHIKIFAVYPESELAAQKELLAEKILAGRLPIAPGNVKVIPQREVGDIKAIINEYSPEADLTVVGMRSETMADKGAGTFSGYDKVGSMLFVNSTHQKEIR